MHPPFRSCASLLLLVLFSSAALACNPFSTSPPKFHTETLEAVATRIDRAQRISLSTDVPRVTVYTPEFFQGSSPSSTPTLAGIPSPSDPPPKISSMTDLSSAALADQKRTIGDSFETNLYERPLQTRTLDYFPHLDISPGAELSIDPFFVFVSIFLVDEPPEGSTANYGAEFDLDNDGRGDWLITVPYPSSTEWIAEGITVYRDSNQDVGGSRAVRSDGDPGDGYDQKMMVQNLEPFALWVRQAPGSNATIQIAFKHALIDHDQIFSWGAWASGRSFHPERWDLNDFYSFEEAGSPLGTSRYYPLKALDLIDNTCRSVVGFTPTSSIPGLCRFTTPTPLPSITPAITTTPEP